MSNRAAGRHRAPGTTNPMSHLSSAVSRSAQPAAKVSAVLAVSGGLVASFSLPASAATLGSAESSAPAADAAHTASAADVAVAATSSADSSVVAPSFGGLGFTAVAKPKPKPQPAPAPAPRVQDRASRSAFRAPITAAVTVAPASSGILGVAASLAGVPYKYGGTSPSTGFDCSGFTQYVFAQVGISIPRTAEEQRQAATPVSNPQPGDLVFFGSPAYHVGIYAGNGMMWDAPHSGTTVGKRAIWTTAVSYGRP